MTVKSRNYFSIIFLIGAAERCREAYRTEQSGAAGYTTAKALSYRAGVVSAVMCAAAALEAMINEVYCDAVVPNSGCIDKVSVDKRQLLTERWAKSFRARGKPETMVKFGCAHQLITGTEPDKADPKWRAAELLFYLRNHFVHFKPSWRTHSTPTGLSQESIELERDLRGRFAESPMSGAMNPFYPDKLLGHGCAEWSLVSAIAFADMFWSGIGVAPVYESYRDMMRSR